MKTSFFIIFITTTLFSFSLNAATFKAGSKHTNQIAVFQGEPHHPHVKLGPVHVEAMTLKEATKKAKQEVINMGGDALAQVETGSKQQSGSIVLNVNQQVGTSTTYTVYFVKGWAVKWETE